MRPPVVTWVLPVLFALALVGTTAATAAATPACAVDDAECREFSRLFEAGRFEQLVNAIKAEKTYSSESRNIIGQAYLMLAGREGNTPAQEERLCLKALEYGATSAYMGLYFIHADADEGKALEYLRQYIATKPKDSVPYVILGEAELQKNNAAAAVGYLRDAKAVARGKSANLDWLLFQASYLTGDYAAAAALLESALSQGKTPSDLKNLLSSDSRFKDFGVRGEFKKYR